MKKFNLVLVLVLVLSLTLVACNKAPATMDETDQSKMQDVASEADTAGDGYHLNSFSIEHEAGITKLEVEVENASGKDINYEYNLETKELIKKDK